MPASGDRDRNLVGHTLHQRQVFIVVGLRLIALYREHAHHLIVKHDRHGEGGLGQARALGCVLQLNTRPFLRPVADQLWEALANGLARRPVAQREVPAGQLVAVVHLPDDLDDLARRVIPPEEADGNVQRGRQLCIHSPQHIRHIQRTRQRATHRAQRRQPSHQPIRTLHLTPFSKASLTQPSLASRLIEKSNKR